MDFSASSYTQGSHNKSKCIKLKYWQTYQSTDYFSRDLIRFTFNTLYTDFTIKTTHKSTLNAIHHDSLGQVHGVGDGEHDQLGLRPRRPVEDVVHHCLFPRP